MEFDYCQEEIDNIITEIRECWWSYLKEEEIIFIEECERAKCLTQSTRNQLVQLYDNIRDF